MGNRLDGFDIEVTFDADGQVDGVSYADGEGCGHSRKVNMLDTVADLVMYHLEHYRKGHKMTPQRYCRFTVPHPQLPKLEFYCTREPHEGNDHELRVRNLAR